MPLHRCHRTLSLTTAIAIAAGPTARAATVTSTWVGATSANWSNPANWSPAAAFPNNSNITDYNVTISAVTTPQNNPTADISTIIDSLTLNAGANLTINTGITLSLTTTTLINAGNITLNGNSTSGNATLSLPASGTTFLTGGGTISLTVATYSQISGGSLVNVDNTIEGQGTISSPLVNQGSLYAIHNVEHLWNGATWDFPLLLTAPVDNTNGALILADDGSISVHTTVTGGTLSTSSGSYLVGNGTLSNITLTAASTLNLPSGFITPSFSGNFTNLGTITNSTGNLSLNNATLTGGGTILLSNSNLSGITGSFTNVDNTIRGQGIIYASAINQATIRAEGGVLSLSTVNNVGGNLSAAANATLYLNGTVTGGNITLDAGGMLASNGTHGTLQNVTLTSGSNWTPTGGALTLAGTFTNHGIVAVYATLIFAPGATTLLNGGGTITLKSMSNISGGNFTNVDNTIQGTGIISANITNQASIIASGGNLTFGPSVTGNGNVIIAPAAGIIASNFTQSSLANDGNFTMSGNGTFGPITGYGATTLSGAHLVLAPNSSTSHQTDLTAPTLHALDLTNNKFIVDPVSKSTTLTKLKSEIAAGDIFSSALTPNTTLLLIDNAVANLTTFNGIPVTTNSLLLATELLGDANLDNHIDLSDLSTVLNNFDTTTPNWTSGNFDHASTIDLTDLSYVLNNFGLTNPNASASQLPTTPTPEPTSIALLPPLVWSSAFRRRRTPTRTDAP